MTMKNFLVFVSLLISLFGCANQDKEKFKDRANAEATEVNEVEQAALDERARKAQLELEARGRFYNAVAGRFEGEFQSSGNDRAIKLILNLMPSMTVYPSEQIRTLDEILADINNLTIGVQAVFETSSMSTGCIFSGDRLDMGKGSLSLINSNCPNAFTIYISQVYASQTEIDAPSVAKETLKIILDGETQSVDQLVIYFQSKNNPSLKKVILRRIKG